MFPEFVFKGYFFLYNVIYKLFGFLGDVDEIEKERRDFLYSSK